MAAFRDYLSLARPGTLVGPALAGFLLPIAAGVHGGLSASEVLTAEWWRILLAMTALAGANFQSNLLNQAWDVAEDTRNKPNRPIPAGRLTRDQVLGLAGLVSIFVLFVAFLVGQTFLGLILLITAAAYAYSAPPIRTKTRLHWNNLAIATPRGALGVLAAWSVAGSILDPAILALAFILAVLTFGANGSKDLGDIEGDRAAGVRNWATEYGRKATLWMIYVFVFLTGIYTYAFVQLRMLPFGMSAFSIAAFVGALAIARMKADSIGKGGNHPSWTVFYFLLALGIVIFSASMILLSPY